MRPRFEAHGDTATRLPRGYRAALYLGLQDFRSTCLFDPEFTPPLRTDLAVDERAGVRLLEERAIAALLIALWCVLIFHRLLSHLGGSFLNWCKSAAAAPVAQAVRLRMTTVRLDSVSH